MTKRAQDFVDSWIGDNIQAGSEGGMPDVELKAKECYHAASLAGISQGEIDEAVGDLAEYIAAAIGGPE